MEGYFLALLIWVVTGFLSWLYQYRHTDRSLFDAFMIGPCTIIGPIALIIMIRAQR